MFPSTVISKLASVIVIAPPSRALPPELASVPGDASRVAIPPETETICLRVSVKPVPDVNIRQLPRSLATKGLIAEETVLEAPITRSVYVAVGKSDCV